MKSNLFRFLTLALLAVFTASFAKAEDTLVLPDDIVVAKGTTSYELEISLDNTGSYTELQFDLTLPANMELRELLDEDGMPYYFIPTKRVPSSTSVESEAHAGGLYKVLMYNGRAVSIKENSGAILTCTIDILDQTPGEYTIEISNQELSGDSSSANPANITTKFFIVDLALSESETTVLLNDEPVTLTASFLPATAPFDATKVTWTSSDTKIATVDGGKVSGVGLGEATIKAEYEGLTASCKVTVAPVPVASVEIESTLDILIGSTGTLTATVLPANATDKTLTWASADEKIATVEDGVVTGVALGTTIITATTANGKTATCTVSVKPVEAESIAMSQTELSIRLEESATLTVTFTPANTTVQTLTWTSADESIATVVDGKVSAVALGTTTITATTNNGKTATCKVTVKPIEAESVSLSQNTLSILIGSEATLTATVAPSNTTDKTLTWTSADETIATVVDGKVTAVALGTTTITVATTNGKTATCEVTVNPILAEGITLSNTEVSIIIGSTATVEATFDPANTTDKTLTWTSADEAVATVADGIITAVGVGSTTITATTTNGKTANCQVTVLPIEVESVTLSQTEATALIGETLTLTATIAPADATYKDLTWTSSDAKIATVKDGVVTTLGVGDVTITATAHNGKEASCKLTVKPVEAESIAMSQTELSIRLEESATLTVTFTPANTTVQTLTWTSADESIATVVDGKVSAVALGTTTITATTNNGKTATCKVTVKPIEAESVSLSQTTLSILIGSEATLTATVAPANTTDKTLTWKSADETIATVVDGKVTAVALGTTTITVSTTNGKTATCEVTVNPILAEGITLSKTEVSIIIGSTASLEATFDPANTTDKTLTWTSADASIATVADGVITAVGVGSTTITATTTNGKTANCQVTVLPIAVETVTLSQTEATILVDETLTVTATVAPADATYKDLTWTSSDAKVATVKDGVITATGVGVATITATAHNGVSASLTLTVNPVLADGITLSQTELSVLIGHSASITATVSPANTTDKTVTWKSADETIATVVNGKINGINLGTTTITATTTNGISATCQVTVMPIEAEGITLSETEITIRLDRTATLTATIDPAETTDKTVTWKSADETIATVDNGVVTPVSLGTTVITASTSNGKTATCQVTVRPAEAEAIELSVTEVSLLVGQESIIVATVYPESYGDDDVNWTSTDASVVTVVNGIITAVGEGEADIIASCDNVSAKCHVTVNRHEQTLSWTPSYTALKVGERIVLDAEASSGLAPTYTIVSGYRNASIEGNVLTVRSEGSFTVRVSQDGDYYYLPAEPIEVIFYGFSSAESLVAADGKVSVIGNEININVDGNDEVRVYDAAGALVYYGTDSRVSVPVKGIYVVVVGNTVTKVLIK